MLKIGEILGEKWYKNQSQVKDNHSEFRSLYFLTWFYLLFFFKLSIHQFTYDSKSSRLLDAGLRLSFWKSFECIVRFWLCVNVVWCDAANILLFFRELTLNWALSKSQIWNYIWSKVWTLMYWHGRDIILMRNWLVLDTKCWISSILDRRRNLPGHPLYWVNETLKNV